MELKNFRNRNVVIKNIPIHIAEMGDASNPAILFIHGWPTNWREFEKTMVILSHNYYVLALDLPGIGESTVPITSYSKSDVATYIFELINHLELKNVTLVGSDIGGQIVYSYVKKYPELLSHAVIMNVAIPGVRPWESVERNPYIWHFAFHSIPDLPEQLIMGKQNSYFSYFYDILCGDKNKLTEDYRNVFSEAYSRLDALSAGFDLYRSFPEDVKNNIATKDIEVEIPVLYIRGDHEFVNIEDYLNGFIENGFKNIEFEILHNSGHFSAIEQPEELSAVLGNFIT